MKKIVLVGRSECGKTTLTQALKGETIHYHKTQYVNHFDVIIDTPGEYAQTKHLGYALALYTYEADVVGMLLSASEPYSLYPPCCTATCNREVIELSPRSMINARMLQGRKGGFALRDAGRSSMWIPSVMKEFPRYWNT